MSQDKSFTFTVDKGNSEDDPALNAGKALSRQIDQVIVPTVDRYRLAVMVGGAEHRAYGAPSKTNAYEKILDVNQMLDDCSVPTAGRAIMVSGDFYKLLKLDSSFVRNSELGQTMLITGQIGEVDGMPVIKDSGRLPKGVSFGIFHPSATTAPHKLAEYKTHIDPPGISGVLVEGRDYYDAFVLKNKRCALGVHHGALIRVDVVNTAGGSGKTRFGLKDKDLLKIGTLCCTLSASPTAPALGDDISNSSTYPALELDTDIAATSGHKYIVLLKDRNGKCIGSSGAATSAAVGA